MQRLPGRSIAAKPVGLRVGIDFSVSVEPALARTKENEIRVKDRRVGIEARRKEQHRTFIFHCPAAVGQQHAVPRMNGNGEASAQDAFRRISGPERLEGGRGHVEPREALMGRFKVGERVESRLLFLRSCTLSSNGSVLWNGTVAVLILIEELVFEEMYFANSDFPKMFRAIFFFNRNDWK